jgi:hypothetical protein
MTMRSIKTTIQLTVLLAVILIMAGCWPLSVHPLYFQEDLIFEEGLVGTWGEDPEEEDLFDLWIFKKATANSYQLIVKEEGNEDGKFETHLLKLGKHYFLDLYPQEPETGNEFYNAHVIPAHSFIRISLEGHILRLGFFDLDWLKDNLEQKRVSIEHERRDDTIVLTASTEELQAFVLEHVEDAFVYEENPLYRQW